MVKSADKINKIFIYYHPHSHSLEYSLLMGCIELFQINSLQNFILKF